MSGYLLLVLLHLFYSINGDIDLVSQRRADRKMSPFRPLLTQKLKVEYENMENSSTRYWDALSSTKKVFHNENEIITTASEHITTTAKEKHTTLDKIASETSIEIATMKEKETATAKEESAINNNKKQISSTTQSKSNTNDLNIVDDVTSETTAQSKSTTHDLNIADDDVTSETTTTKKKLTAKPTKGTNGKSSKKKTKTKIKTTTKGKSKNEHTTDERENKPTNLDPYDIKNNLLKVMRKFPNANVTAEVIGRSVEYKDIVLLKITDKNNEDKKTRREGEDNLKKESKSGEKIDAEGKKIIFIVHGLSTFDLWKIPCLYEKTQFKLLMSFYLSHLKNFDIFVIPVANPDGFAREDNLWNKNVSPQEDCGGVALDRNFDVAWDLRSNESSCDQLYPGPAPFSEAESEAIKDVFLQYGKKIAAYIHVHATDNNFDYKGNTVLVPKGYTDEESDEDKYIDMKGEIDEAIRKAKFDIVSVNVKTMYSWYGPVAGTSVDYASEVMKVPFALEFLMQPYAAETKRVKKDLNRAALTHIWKRIINTVFNFIHEINNSNETD